MANAKKISKKVGGRKNNSARRPSSTRSRKPRVMATWKYVTIATLMTTCVLALAYWPIIRPAFNRFRPCTGHHIYGACIPKGYSVYGIDISHHQGEINWSKLKKGNPGEPPISFVYIKATEGSSHNDTRFAKNWNAAKKNGIARGAYHYFGTKTPGEKQARNFISKVTLEPGDLPPMVDVEDEPKNAAAYRLELKKTGLKVFCSIGNILHYMRGAPYLCNAHLLFTGKGTEGLFNSLDTIIHSEKNVRMTVNGSLQDAAFQYGYLACEKSQKSHNYSPYP